MGAGSGPYQLSSAEEPIPQTLETVGSVVRVSGTAQ